MKTTQLTQYFLIAFLCFNALHAQTKTQISNEDRSGQWLFGLGLNIVEDSAQSLDEGTSFNFSNPYIFDVEYTFNSQFSFFGNLSFNKYEAGKIVDNRIVQEGGEANYVAFDAGSNFYFRKILNNYTFEPYITAGFGYTNIGSYQASFPGSTQAIEIPSTGRMTFNPGFGANFWFSPSWGMNVNAVGKFKMESKDYVTNHMQFSFGVIYSAGIHNNRTKREQKVND